MRRVLVLALPDLAIDLARRRRRRAERPLPGAAAPLDVGPPRAGSRAGKRTTRAAPWPHPGSPILLTENVGGRVLVVRRCPSAAARGVRIGAALDEARALVAPAQPCVEEHRPHRDARALAALGQWALRFSPTVALDPEGGVVLDLAGLERLVGDEERSTRRILEAVARLGLRARAAVADTLGAASALARHGPRSPIIVPSGDEERALAPLPVVALRLPPAVVDGLRELSVAHIGDLVSLDRARLAARFGGDVLLRLDQAFGRAFEALTPLRPEEPPELERTFEGPVRQLEAVLLTIEELLHELCALLGAAGLGATEVLVELATSDRPPGAPPERLVVHLGRASASPRHLWNVTRPRAELMHLGFGVESVRLVARRTARLPLAQASAFERSAVECALTKRGLERQLDRALAELVDVLVSRLGAEAVRVPRAVETHVPERAYRARPLLQEDDPLARLRAGAARATAAPRPSLLFPRPEPAHLDAPQPAGRLRWRARDLELVDVLGPERIARPWWEVRDADAPEVTRDYYRVRTSCGRRLWLFVREGATFVHGEWA